MARLHGRRGQISLASSTTPEGSPADLDFTVVGSLQSYDISFTRDKTDVTCFGDVNKVFLAGLADTSGKFDGVFDTDYIQTLLNAGDESDGVWIRITPSTDYPELFFQGPAWLDASVNGSVNDAIKVSGTFSANGTWQRSFNA
jgi:hypothetical protein